MADCLINSASEIIVGLIHRYGSQQQLPGSPEDIFYMGFMSADLGIIYTPLDTVESISSSKFTYYSIPGLYILLNSSSTDTSGTLATHTSPTLSNQGRGVMIGIIDTGIDYTSLLFHNQDGTTRILSIWDQSPPKDRNLFPVGVPDRYNANGAIYGTEYTREQVNEALESDNPLTVVPSTDTNGCETFLTDIATGGVLLSQDFTGAAPECELIIIKLKPAK